VAVLLSNCFTCANGSIAHSTFGLAPPSMRNYLHPPAVAGLDACLDAHELDKPRLNLL
jgi:hypothetical protein